MSRHQIVLKFPDGEELAGRLQAPFDPARTKLLIELEEGQRQVAFRLADLCYIRFLDGYEGRSREPGTLEEVTTSCGGCFRVHVPESEIFAGGFFGFPADNGGDWQAIFFCLQGVKRRQLSERLGEILVRHGAVPEKAVQAALNEQERLRGRRVGEILSERHQLPRETIEKTLAGAAGMTNLPENARVGDILVAAGLVTRPQVELAVAEQQQGKHKKIGDLLIERGLITENQLMAALAAKFRLRLVDLPAMEPQEEALLALSSGMAHRLGVLPLARDGNTLTVATSSPTDHTLVESLRFATGCSIDLVVAYEADIAAALDRCYPSGDAVGSILGQLSGENASPEEDEYAAEITESDSQVINLVNRLLVEAHRKGVSDLHFEPGQGTGPLRVRQRIDGLCHVAYVIAGGFKRAVLARLKILANLDIAEHRRPQSGKILLRAGRTVMEFRVEITPTAGNLEDAVLRVLGAVRPLPLAQLGFTPANLERVQQLLAKPYGIILCVGPTGSGKTTTLHSALAAINQPERKIWTVEDPVEITQHGLRQIPVNPRIGFSFPEALRSLLRADPDVIMIGEMRDAETAGIALRASLTGHLVLSTLHTNSAAETVTRLIDMGMDPFNFSDALLGVLAQRLVRRLCPECRRAEPASRGEYAELLRIYGEELAIADGLPAWTGEAVLMRPAGCNACHGTGYRGRLPLHELLLGSEEIKAAIREGAPQENLRRLALEQGMRTLKMDGIGKVLAGETDLPQVLQVCL